MSSSRGARVRPNPSGVHLLCCPRVSARLVGGAALAAGDLVIDLGAGPGTLTAPLAGTGARVLAVERDERFARALDRRFAGCPLVRVVLADLRAVPLPRRDFVVVANPPFAVSTALLRRLLTPVPARLTRAELLVEWGLARRLTEPRPRDLETAWWTARFDVTLERRVPARCFTPAPGVDAAHLRIRRSDVDLRAQAFLWRLLGSAYRRPGTPARHVLGEFVPHRLATRLLRARHTDPAAPAADVPIGQWTRLAAALSADRSRPAPPLPTAVRASSAGRGR